VKGYSKSTEYLPGEEFVDTRYRNTWNAVYVAGGWRLIQCNWAMLNLHSKVERETRKFYQVKKYWPQDNFHVILEISNLETSVWVRGSGKVTPC
jgi:hypothetical protein